MPESSKARVSVSYSGPPEDMPPAIANSLNEGGQQTAEADEDEEGDGTDALPQLPAEPFHLKASEIPTEMTFERVYELGRMDPEAQVAITRLSPKKFQRRELKLKRVLHIRPISGEEFGVVQKRIEEQFGGGEYTFEVRGSDGYRARCKNVLIEGDPILSPSMSDAAADNPNLDDLDQANLENAKLQAELEAIKQYGPKESESSGTMALFMQMFQTQADQARKDAERRDERDREEAKRRDKTDREDRDRREKLDAERSAERLEAAKTMSEIQIKAMEGQNKLLAKQAEGGNDMDRIVAMFTGIDKLKAIIHPPEQEKGVVGEVLDVLKEGASLLAGAMEAKKTTGRAALPGRVPRGAPPRGTPQGLPGPTQPNQPAGGDAVYEAEGEQLAMQKVHQVLKVLISETHHFSFVPQWVELALDNLPNELLKKLADMESPDDLPKILAPYRVPKKVFTGLWFFSKKGEDEKQWFLRGFQMIKEAVYETGTEEEDGEPGGDGLLTDDSDLGYDGEEHGFQEAGPTITPISAAPSPGDESQPAATPAAAVPVETASHPSDDDLTELHEEMSREENQGG